MNTAIIMDMMFNTEMIVKDMKGGKEDMTEKRFTIIDGVKKGTHSGIWDNQKQNNQRIGDELWLGEVVVMLNEGVMIAKENEQLKSEIEKLSYANEDLLTQKRNWEKLSDEYAKVYEENEQLKQRNDRQAKQLDRIYQLIEEKDWRTLNDILDDFKQCEEQLQREWKCYE